MTNETFLKCLWLSRTGENTAQSYSKKSLKKSQGVIVVSTKVQTPFKEVPSVTGYS